MAVEKRKKELLAESKAMAVAKTTRLRMQQEDLKMLNASMKLAISSVQHGTQSYTAEEFLAIQKMLKRSCLLLKKPFATASFDPVDSVPMIARVNVADVVSAVGSIGSVEERFPCSPAHCSLVGVNKQWSIGIVAGARRTLIVQTRNRRGEPMRTGQVKVRAWVVRGFSQQRIRDAEVSSSNHGKYSVSIYVPYECYGKAHFTADGEHIDGSFFDIVVREYVGFLKPGNCILIQLSNS